MNDMKKLIIILIIIGVIGFVLTIGTIIFVIMISGMGQDLVSGANYY